MENYNNKWLNEVKRMFKKGDKVIGTVKFSASSSGDNLKGRVKGVYQNFVVVDFGSFMHSYKWHDVYLGALKPARRNCGTKEGSG